MRNDHFYARRGVAIRWAEEPLNRLLLTLTGTALVTALTIVSVAVYLTVH